MFTERRYSKGVRPLRLLDSEIDVTQQDKYTEVIQEEGMAFGQCTRTFGRTWGLKPKYLYQLNLNNFCLTNFLIMDVLCDDKKGRSENNPNKVRPSPKEVRNGDIRRILSDDGLPHIHP